MPGGIPRYVRCYDNGGGFTHFCRKCLQFSDEDPTGTCRVNGCGHRLLKAGPGSCDRYTVVYTGNYKGRGGRTEYAAMSGSPFHPQGFGQHGETPHITDAPNGKRPPAIGGKAAWGNGDSRRIPFAALPPDCQKLVLKDYEENWRLSPTQPNLIK